MAPMFEACEDIIIWIYLCTAWIVGVCPYAFDGGMALLL
jgi:hypothetical protein